MDTQNKKKILIIDDDVVIRGLIAQILEDDFELLPSAANGKAGLLATAQLQPDIILLDISLPDMSGYELCRILKEDRSTAAIPVIFLSGIVGLSEHLKGHEVGGEDFLSKPFDVSEFKYKVLLALRRAEERKQLNASIHDAFSTAMTAMSSAAEIGVVLQFFKDSFSCRDYGQLADTMIAACEGFGLTAIVQLRGQYDQVSRNEAGDSSELERSILNHVATFGRIVDFSRRSAFNYQRVTLLIVDMPKEEPDRYGRLRDHLTSMAEGCDARVQALDYQLATEARHRELQALVAKVRAALAEIEQSNRQQRLDSEAAVVAMQEHAEQAFFHLGLTESQERQLLGIMQQAGREISAIFDKGLAIDRHLSAVTEQLSVGIS